MKPLLVTLCALVFSASGCSNGSGGSADSDGIDGKELVELTTAERAQFCATNRDTFAALAVGSCVLSGLETAPTTADCEQFRSDCQMPAADGAVCEGGDAGLPDFTDCGALRVSQVESCLAQAKTFFANLDCSAFGKEPTGAPTCLADVEESCPALLTPFQ
ncbi:MAG TPA: hypothetical protein VHC69_35845 [Polyangiaceae bacterium]|nr:hypothetical protein [Polyangiaceae bacterium]